MAKEEYIAFRTSAQVKQILEDVAKKDYRSLSQQCEMIIVQWLKEHNHIKDDSKK
jgi:hypothetical protein